MNEDDLRAFYDTYYADMFVVPYDDAPNALKIRLRLALEMVDDLRAERDRDMRPAARVIKVTERRVA